MWADGIAEPPEPLNSEPNTEADEALPKGTGLIAGFFAIAPALLKRLAF